jgi:hypothetical protein
MGAWAMLCAEEGSGLLCRLCLREVTSGAVRHLSVSRNGRGAVRQLRGRWWRGMGGVYRCALLEMGDGR